ncbi:hypothetical protein Tco_0837203 [Tanacetum coccineum]
MNNESLVEEKRKKDKKKKLERMKKVNSGCVVENVLMEYGGTFVRNVGNKKYNKYKESKEMRKLKVKVVALTQVSDDGFLEVTHKHRKGKQIVNVNDEASTLPPKENKEASLQPKSNVNALEEDNGKLIDDTRKKVKAPPKKTPRKTGIWMIWIFDDMGQAVKEVDHENAYSDNG